MEAALLSLQPFPSSATQRRLSPFNLHNTLTRPSSYAPLRAQKVSLFHPIQSSCFYLILRIVYNM